MKAALLVVLVFGLTVFAGAQTAAPTFELKFGTMQVADSVSHLRDVELKFGTIRITADEADMNATTGEADLRGNVHLSTK